MELYAAGEVWYLMREGEEKGWRWQQLEGQWRVDRHRRPEGAARARVEDLPASLREELLAFAARAAAMGPQP